MNAPSTMSATTLRLFFEAVERIGVDREALLRACDIEASSLEDSEARIPQSASAARPSASSEPPALARSAST